jgi:hypothetical protein
MIYKPLVNTLQSKILIIISLTLDLAQAKDMVEIGAYVSVEVSCICGTGVRSEHPLQMDSDMDDGAVSKRKYPFADPHSAHIPEFRQCYIEPQTLQPFQGQVHPANLLTLPVATATPEFGLFVMYRDTS